MLLGPGWTRWATGAVDERFHVIRMNPEPRGSPRDFLATAAQIHLEAEVTRSVTKRELIHHAVRGALQLIRLPNHRHRFWQVGEWRLADGEGDDGIRWRQVGDD